MLISTSITVFSQQKINEYKYDDGSYDVNAAIISNNSGQQIGMGFDLGNQKQLIKEVKFYISAGTLDNVKANIHVYTYLGNVANELAVIPFIPTKMKDWNIIDISKYNIIASDYILISIEWLTATGETEPYKSFFIGMKVAGVKNHNAYLKYSNGEWFPARRWGNDGGPKNFLIRLITENS
jgi:hypothetical protein